MACRGSGRDAGQRLRFLVDMNLSPAWVAALRAGGHEAEHWSDIGDPKATDALIMSVAAEQGAVELTNDLDFGSILAAAGSSGPSVIQIRAADLRPSSLGEVVLLAIERVGDELARGALVTVEPGRTRLRVLPLSVE